MGYQKSRTNNRPQFIASVCSHCLISFEIKQTLVPPCHPALSGAAVWSIWMLKKNLKKQVSSYKNKETFRLTCNPFVCLQKHTAHSDWRKSSIVLFKKLMHLYKSGVIFKVNRDNWKQTETANIMISQPFIMIIQPGKKELVVGVQKNGIKE